MNDKTILRDLAKRYAEIAALPIQEERRNLWDDHNSLKPTHIPILVMVGMWDAWCHEAFGDANMKCEDPFLRRFERDLRLKLFQYDIGDDSIQEPWITLRINPKGCVAGHLWGVDESLHNLYGVGTAGRYNPPLKTWDDVANLRMTHHGIDEAEVQRDLERLDPILGDILPIDVQRTPCYIGFMMDISTSLARLRGLEQLMVDMYESPKELHRLLAFLRDGILTNNQEAEDAGHYTLTSSNNQQPPYARELERVAANSGPRKRKELWGFCAAQEYTLISPAFHEEFMFQYQTPIYANFGLVHYGCCEDLGEKMSMLRQWKNLRSIAIAPLANVRRCAEQIQGKYVMSWRPNPTDMVCYGYDEDRIEKIVRKAMDDSAGNTVHINLKDISTLEGDTMRLKRWVQKVRQCVE